jgi:predicted Zn-dependent protease
MTGTGLSVVSQNDSVSYNRSVNVINVHQKDNVNKLENALINANRNNDILQEALSTVIRTINNCKKQIFNKGI